MYIGILMQFKYLSLQSITKITNNKYSHKVLYIQASYKVLLEKKYWDAFSYLVLKKYQKKEEKEDEVKASLP